MAAKRLRGARPQEAQGLDVRLSDIAFGEDGYSDEIGLLCGATVDGVRHSTFSFREMNGSDEEAISRGDMRANPAKVYHALLERCVRSVGALDKKELGPRAWSDLMRRMYVGDQDWIVFAIRAASLGREIKISHICSSTDESLINSSSDMALTALFQSSALQTIYNLAA